MTFSFINIHNDEVVNHFTNESIHKVFGEVAQTYHILTAIKSLYNGMNIQNIFKRHLESFRKHWKDLESFRKP
mgnify:CR=1 FL=1